MQSRTAAILPILLVVACASSIVLARASAVAEGGRGGRGRYSPPEFTFKDDVLQERRHDTNSDGKIDDWRTFDRGYLVQVELDLDHDGKPDWRETWSRPASPVLAFNLKFVDGRWRMLPLEYLISGDYQQINLHRITARGDYTGHAEKRIDGVWTDTFDHAESETVTIRPYGDDMSLGEITTQWKRAIRCENGKPTRATSDSADERYLAQWKDGTLVRREQVVKKEKTVFLFQDGRQKSAETLDEHDQPIRRVSAEGVQAYRHGAWTGDFETVTGTRRQIFRAGKLAREELLRDGVWTGDFEEPMSNGRKVFRDGRLTLQENTGDGVTYRTHYEADGTSLLERVDKNGEVYLRANAQTNRVEKKINGTWTGDFIDGTTTYRNATRSSDDYSPNGFGDKMKMIVTYISDTEQQWSDGKVTRVWCFSDQKHNPIREARDLDGDGKPDLVADFVKVTLVQPEPPRPPVP